MKYGAGGQGASGADFAVLCGRSVSVGVSVGVGVSGGGGGGICIGIDMSDDISSGSSESNGCRSR